MGIGKYILYTALVVSGPAFMGCPDTDKPNPESPMYEVQKLERQVAEDLKKEEKNVEHAKDDLEGSLKDADRAVEKLLDAYKNLEEVEKELDKSIEDMDKE